MQVVYTMSYGWRLLFLAAIAVGIATGISSVWLVVWLFGRAILAPFWFVF